MDEDTILSLATRGPKAWLLLRLLLLSLQQPIPASMSQFLSHLKIQPCLMNVFMTYSKRMAIKPPPQADSLIMLKQHHLNILRITLW